MSTSISAGIGNLPCFTTFSCSLVSLLFVLRSLIQLKIPNFPSTCRSITSMFLPCVCTLMHVHSTITHSTITQSTITHSSVETGSGHPGHPGHPGHIFSGSSGSDPVYNLSGSDPDWIT